MIGKIKKELVNKKKNKRIVEKVQGIKGWCLRSKYHRELKDQL